MGPERVFSSSLNQTNKPRTAWRAARRSSPREAFPLPPLSLSTARSPCSQIGRGPPSGRTCGPSCRGPSCRGPPCRPILEYGPRSVGRERESLFVSGARARECLLVSGSRVRESSFQWGERESLLVSGARERESLLVSWARERLLVGRLRERESSRFVPNDSAAGRAGRPSGPHTGGWREGGEGRDNSLPCGPDGGGPVLWPTHGRRAHMGRQGIDMRADEAALGESLGE